MERKYLLVLKRNHNNYLPIEWNLTKYYEKENLTTLEGIDKFTSKMTEVELILNLLDLNVISKDESFMQFSIIYYEKDKNRELKDGTIFKESPYQIDEKDIIKYIYDNIDNKQMINEIISKLKKHPDTNINNYIYILKNNSIFKGKGDKYLLSSISLYSELPYDIKRELKIFITDKYM